MTTVMRLTSSCMLRAVENQALPTSFSGVAYSGGPVPSHGVIIDLDTTDVPPKMPLLAEHERSDIIGVITTATVQHHQILVAGKVFSDIAGSRAERIAQSSVRGAPFQMSVGLFGYSEDYIPQGRSTTVNSRTVVGPLTVLRHGKVRECSIVALGADAEADARFFSASAPSPMPSRVTLSASAIYARRLADGR